MSHQNMFQELCPATVGNIVSMLTSFQQVKCRGSCIHTLNKISHCSCIHMLTQPWTTQPGRWNAQIIVLSMLVCTVQTSHSNQKESRCTNRPLLRSWHESAHDGCRGIQDGLALSAIHEPQGLPLQRLTQCGAIVPMQQQPTDCVDWKMLTVNFDNICIVSIWRAYTCLCSCAATEGDRSLRRLLWQYLVSDSAPMEWRHPFNLKAQPSLIIGSDHV